MNRNKDLASHASDELESLEFGELRAAQERARSLHDQAVGRERARLRSVCEALNITAEELLGLPPRKRVRARTAVTE